MADRAGPGTEVMDVLRKVVDGATSRIVFGEPITRDGVTVVPAARVSGGGGGGGGGGPAPDGREASGAGSGMGLNARPAGMFVIKDGKVAWRPVVDVNRLVLGGQIVAVVALLVIRTLIRSRRRS